MFLDKYKVQMLMRFNEIHKFSDGTLRQIDEALDYRVKEFRINKMNPSLNTRFWIKNDVDQSKAFMFDIQKRLKIRRIFRNLESFVGGRVREGDYRLLKLKMEILLEPTSNKLLVANELTNAFEKPFEVLNNVFEHWVFNSLVHSLRALSALRRSGLRTASTAAKPCQGDSLEFYLITGNYTPASPDYSPASDTESDLSENPSSDLIPPLPATSLFLSSTDDSSNSDIPDIQPSPTHETSSDSPSDDLSDSSSNHSLPAPSSSMRPSHHLSSLVPSIPRLSVAITNRPSHDSSSAKTSSDPSSDELSDPLYDHSLPAPSLGMRPSHHLCSLVLSIPHSSAVITDRPSHDSSSASPSRKRSRSPVVSVSLSLPIPGSLSYARADLLPLPKRIRSSKYLTHYCYSLLL
nr:hypothetical protein [Tanacetum cinerariifolium]